MGAAICFDEAIVDAVFTSFGFDRLPAAYALGDITFYSDILDIEDRTIPAGTRVQALGGGVVYQTLQEGVIPAGEYAVTVPARAETEGEYGNVEKGALTVILSDIPLNTEAANAIGIDTGAAEETDAERRDRFANYIQSLARGTVSSLDYAARLAILTDASGNVTEQVKHVAMAETPGTVRLYIHNGAGDTSLALVDRVVEIIEGEADYTGIITPGWRAAGVEVIVAAMNDVPVTLHLEASAETGYDSASVRDAIESALLARLRDFAGDYLSVPALLSAIYSTPGVISVTLLEPLEGISLTPDQRAVLGTLTIDWQ
jgi:uncharacterized phage protein gp47/JayE